MQVIFFSILSPYLLIHSASDLCPGRIHGTSFCPSITQKFLYYLNLMFGCILNSRSKMFMKNLTVSKFLGISRPVLWPLILSLDFCTVFPTYSKWCLLELSSKLNWQNDSLRISFLQIQYNVCSATELKKLIFK